VFRRRLRGKKDHSDALNELRLFICRTVLQFKSSMPSSGSRRRKASAGDSWLLSLRISMFLRGVTTQRPWTCSYKEWMAVDVIVELPVRFEPRPCEQLTTRRSSDGWTHRPRGNSRDRVPDMRATSPATRLLPGIRCSVPGLHPIALESRRIGQILWRNRQAPGPLADYTRYR
jgi:hypothetical protein